MARLKDLPPFYEPPEELLDLLVSQTGKTARFRDHIRAYNGALAMLSMGAAVSPPPGHGPFVFRIQGAVCHCSGSLLPEDGCDPVYVQLYVYDPADALDMRVRRHPATDRDVMESLQTMLLVHNAYSQSYRHMYEVLQEEERKAAAHGTAVPNLSMSCVASADHGAAFRSSS